MAAQLELVVAGLLATFVSTTAVAVFGFAALKCSRGEVDLSCTLMLCVGVANITVLNNAFPVLLESHPGWWRVMCFLVLSAYAAAGLALDDAWTCAGFSTNKYYRELYLFYSLCAALVMLPLAILGPKLVAHKALDCARWCIKGRTAQHLPLVASPPPTPLQTSKEALAAIIMERIMTASVDDADKIIAKLSLDAAPKRHRGKIDFIKLPNNKTCTLAELVRGYVDALRLWW